MDFELGCSLLGVYLFGACFCSLLGAYCCSLFGGYFWSFFGGYFEPIWFLSWLALSLNPAWLAAWLLVTWLLVAWLPDGFESSTILESRSSVSVTNKGKVSFYSSKTSSFSESEYLEEL